MTPRSWSCRGKSRWDQRTGPREQAETRALVLLLAAMLLLSVLLVFAPPDLPRLLVLDFLKPPKSPESPLVLAEAF